MKSFGMMGRSSQVFRFQAFCFMNLFLQFALNLIRSWPCSPFASACFEHSIPSGVCGAVVALPFGVGFVVGEAAGGVVGDGVCAKTLPAQNEPAIAARTILLMSIPHRSNSFHHFLIHTCA
jgi:hypothetical protein